MSRNRLDAERGLNQLKSVWREIQSLSWEEISEVNFVRDEVLKEKIAQLMNSRTKAFKYALITQVLAKVIAPSINCLAIQAQASVPGAFDARSFCKKTIVLFEREHLNDVLGASADPYVGKPLRHEMISLENLEHIKDKEGWKNLYTILSKIEERNAPEFARDVLKQILLEIWKLLLQQEISPPRLPSITTENLKTILINYLNEPSQGLRPQAIVYAFFKTFNEKTRTFDEINTDRPTVADSFTGRVSDIECKDREGNLKLAICVTDQLNTEKLKNELEKATRNNIPNILIVSHRINITPQESEKIVKEYNKLNIAVSLLIDFILTMTVMLNNEMRKKLVLEMYKVLKDLKSPEHLRKWDEIVKKILS